MRTVPVDLPLAIDDVTPEWLTAAIGSSRRGVEVTRAERLETLWGTGTKVLYELAYNAAGRAAGLPTRVWVKGGFAEHREAMLFLYQLEARFFAELAPQLAVRTPRCLFSASSAEQGVVILEDLRQAGGRDLPCAAGPHL